MESPIFRLEEQLSDLRSDQIAYRLTIENPDSKPIQLLSVEPKIPVGANLVQITDISITEANARKADLIGELNVLLKDFLLVTSENFMQVLVDKSKKVIKEVFSVSGFLRAYYEIIKGSWQARIKRELGSFYFEIASASDARSAYMRWMDTSSEHETIKTLFIAKVEQLECIEALMEESDRLGLTAIQPKSCFTATYVIRFKRGILEPKKYQVGFEATYQHPDTASPLSNSTATNVQISPHPFSLTIVAIIAALLGVLLRVSLGGAQNPLHEMLLLAKSGKLLVGPIIAVIFFNVFEYTSLGKGIGMSVSWRSALLIGALCGVAQDRVLAALKALIGA